MWAVIFTSYKRVNCKNSSTLQGRSKAPTRKLLFYHSLTVIKLSLHATSWITLAYNLFIFSCRVFLYIYLANRIFQLSLTYIAAIVFTYDYFTCIVIFYICTNLGTFLRWNLSIIVYNTDSNSRIASGGQIIWITVRERPFDDCMTSYVQWFTGISADVTST